MNTLDRTVADVGDKTTIVASLMQLLHNVATEIRATAGNETAAHGLADMVDEHSEHMSKVVMANTPMILATPPVHPSPANAGGAPDKLDVVSMTGTPEEIAEWQKEHSDLHEIERVENADKSITAYFRARHEAVKPD